MDKTKILIIGLLLSVGVNLFFVGGIGARMLTRPDPGFRPFPPNMAWVVRDLGEARRAELAPIVESSSQAIRPLRAAMFETQRRVNQLMTEQPLDVTAINQAFADLRTANINYQELSHQQSVEILAELSASEREQAMQFLDRRGSRDRIRGGFGPPGEGLERRMRWGRNRNFGPRPGLPPPPAPD
ncbi:MAG: periplasmic heavy metal sensor [Gammaproteobacteria bacterium]|jgi:uncharacterized membrane protein|nr:hypothetical protein [Gammaproteobacteria bacterium]MDP6097549.1 periplasmic heavy metal sensor [Gammaproteobacteria bacterium]HJO12070.1 periplasmic heavy metal sensor [Gammaproteobacteria bacterium]|tara:strand:- start:898 stop:1452 length:555 start_codon:yes stop_codon:yes gene_type:complete